MYVSYVLLTGGRVRVTLCVQARPDLSRHAQILCGALLLVVVPRRQDGSLSLTVLLPLLLLCVSSLFLCYFS